jgi:hypothetical protein
MAKGQGSQARQVTDASSSAQAPFAAYSQGHEEPAEAPQPAPPYAAYSQGQEHPMQTPQRMPPYAAHSRGQEESTQPAAPTPPAYAAYGRLQERQPTEGPHTPLEPAYAAYSRSEPIHAQRPQDPYAKVAHLGHLAPGHVSPRRNA